MKLPDFYNFEPLNVLKNRMGIKRGVYGTLNVEVKPPRIPFDDLKKLGEEGLDVRFDELTFLQDGTIALKNNRVLVYIRDRSVYADLPKFHFAACNALIRMKQIHQIDKYVAATRMDGSFELNITGYGPPKPQTKRLDVCRYCLDQLRYNNYSRNSPEETRQRAVREFSIPEFFERYPTSLLARTPKYNSDNAPVNNYTEDFEQVSLHFRDSKNWTCEECGTKLATKPEYLHTHHLNGMKNENQSDNLQALCIACHAEKPNHGHLKRDPRYAAYLCSGLRNPAPPLRPPS
jgi:hypothetical protein